METNEAPKRWQDWGNLIVGAWLFVSPFVLQYPSEMPNAVWNAYILGAAIMIFSAFAVYLPRAWEEGINVVLGLWMIASPWALGFASDKNITMNAVIVGILVAILAAWAVLHDKDFEKWRHEHHIAP